MKDTLICSPNHFKEDLGSLDEEKKARIIKLLRAFMASIRELRDAAKSHLDVSCLDNKDGCATCAFAPETDSWNGFAATAYGLVWALSEGKLFMCHGNQPMWKENQIDVTKLIRCTGFVTVCTVYPLRAKEIASETMEAIRVVKVL